MKITHGAKLILNTLTSAGFEAYVVGGSVRDFLMGLPCNDIDITTSATPEEMEDVFKSNAIKYVETGLLHGTITAVIDGAPFEVTTFRFDGEYEDSRHPKNVRFITDINEDLARRDFTINAIAWNEKDGFVDPFGGMKDINSQTIRAVGDPNERFCEDALRIMRAIRFASKLGFAIDETTKAAMFKHSKLLKNVSRERIMSELSKLLLGNNVFYVLTAYKEILGVVLPELKDSFNCKQNNPWHLYDVYTHSAKAVEASPRELALRLTMLFHDTGKPLCKTTDDNGIDHFYGHPKISSVIAKKSLKSLRAPNSLLERVVQLVELHDTMIQNNEKNIKKWLRKVGADRTLDIINVKRSDMLAQNFEKTKSEILELERTRMLFFEIVHRGDPFTVADLKVNGHDIMALGFHGREVGEVLNSLLDKVISGETENTKEALLGSINNKNAPV